MRAMRRPSGAQDGSLARPSAIRRGSPPTVGDRKSPNGAADPRRKSSVLPSGENRGVESDGPAVSATSSPVASCFSQMRERPSRVEVKAIVLPSGDAEGPDSLPL